MAALGPRLLAADAVVLASPIYYYGLTAQLKTVIDRFYAFNEGLRVPKKSALLLAFADSTMESAEGVITAYRHMARYMRWEDQGVVAARGCYTAEDVLATEYPRLARVLGE